VSWPLGGRRVQEEATGGAEEDEGDGSEGRAEGTDGWSGHQEVWWKEVTTAPLLPLPPIEPPVCVYR
jgi:hypothetical protein